MGVAYPYRQKDHIKKMEGPILDKIIDAYSFFGNQNGGVASFGPIKRFDKTLHPIGRTLCLYIQPAEIPYGARFCIVQIYRMSML